MPGAAPAVAWTVSVAAPPTANALVSKSAVTPPGTPSMVSITFCGLPDTSIVAIDDVALAPCATEMLLGVALTLKSSTGASITVIVTVVACVADVPVPVTVTVYVPVAVELPAVRVSVELAPDVTLAGLNDAVAPAGRPVAVNATDCAAPVVTCVSMPTVPLWPCTSVTPLALALIEKSSMTCAVTVNDHASSCASPTSRCR